MSTPRMRTGRTLGRTLYLMSPGEDRKADTCIGMADTPELAEQITAAWNERADVSAVTRFEVIDHTTLAKTCGVAGRAFLADGGIAVELGWQDNDATLMVFLTDRPEGEAS